MPHKGKKADQDGGGADGSEKSSKSASAKSAISIVKLVREVEAVVLPRLAEITSQMAAEEQQQEGEPSKGDRCRQAAALFWEHKDRGPIVEDMCKVLDKARSLLKHEPRVVQVGVPVYIFGDIHGNLLDLMSYEKILWNDKPLPGTSYLFLGDYVDRGYFSLECFVYLMACKVIHPQAYFFVRGNHEERTVQRNYSFYQECLVKLGQNWGNQVWELCNKACDSLPLAAIVDTNIFCAHGGIPRSTLKIEDINQISNVLNDPVRQSYVAWELLWNDPLNLQDFDAQAATMQANSEDIQRGFLPNRLRGAGFYFNEHAVDNFFASNGLTHCIRGHQTPKDGYEVLMNGKVITVFSSSCYSETNPASVMYVAPDEILGLLMNAAPTGERKNQNLKMTAVFRLPRHQAS